MEYLTAHEEALFSRHCSDAEDVCHGVGDTFGEELRALVGGGIAFDDGETFGMAELVAGGLAEGSEEVESATGPSEGNGTRDIRKLMSQAVGLAGGGAAGSSEAAGAGDAAAGAGTAAGLGRLAGCRSVLAPPPALAGAASADSPGQLCGQLDEQWQEAVRGCGLLREPEEEPASEGEGEDGHYPASPRGGGGRCRGEGRPPPASAAWPTH